MASDNETVVQVALSDLPLAERVRIIRDNYCIGSGEFDALDEAADAMEREKKHKKKRKKSYEYSYRFLDGDVAAGHRENPRMVFGDSVNGRVLVRREVGEWEDVKKS